MAGPHAVMVLTAGPITLMQHFLIFNYLSAEMSEYAEESCTVWHARAAPVFLRSLSIQSKLVPQATIHTQLSRRFEPCKPYMPHVYITVGKGMSFRFPASP